MNDLPALAQPSLLPDSMPMGLRIMFDPKLMDVCKDVAKVLAGSRGFVPKHLEGQTYACFAVVVRALTWRLDPFSVATSTYQTPGGIVGYEGKLILAVLNNSGRFEESIKFEYYGDWEKLEDNFNIVKSKKGNDYPVPGWIRDDEIGVGVEITGHVKGEAEPRNFRFDLRTAHPRNSTLWAIRPKQQICYTAVRAFANLCTPEILMGVMFDFEDAEAGMVDITPDIKPSRGTAAPLPEDIRTLGREDYANGQSFRQHPQNLTAEQVEHWREGWQAADAEFHDGSQDQEAKPAETKQVDETAASETKPNASAKPKAAAKPVTKTKEADKPATKPKTDSKPATIEGDQSKPVAASDSPSDLFEHESPHEALRRLLDRVEQANSMDELGAICTEEDPTIKALPQDQFDKFDEAYSTKHIKFSGT